MLSVSGKEELAPFPTVLVLGKESDAMLCTFSVSGREVTTVVKEAVSISVDLLAPSLPPPPTV